MVSILVTVVVLALLLTAVVGSLFFPVPEQLTKWARPLALWRRESVRQRFHQRRWLFLSYLGLAVIAGVVAVIWVLPALLTRHPHIDSAAERHQAIAATRTGLVAGLAVIGAAGGLAYTARTYRLSREGHITDRYSKAVEQLGSENIEVRLGGIYALERLMRDSPADQPTIMETLSAYVRQHAPRNPSPATVDRDRRVAGHRRPRSVPASSRLVEDVQAILTVLGRRHPVANEGRIDLSNTDLTGAVLEGATLADAELHGATLTRANFWRANLFGAGLGGATLTDARLVRANLSYALLDGATLTDALLDGANLTRASLGAATLTDANLVVANLTRADLGAANLSGADFGWANLTRADLGAANLTDANFRGVNLTGARLDEANLTGAVFTSDALSPEQRATALHVDEIRWLPR